VIERRARMMMEKKGDGNNMGDWMGGQLVYISPTLRDN